MTYIGLSQLLNTAALRLHFVRSASGAKLIRRASDPAFSYRSDVGPLQREPNGPRATAKQAANAVASHNG